VSLVFKDNPPKSSLVVLMHLVGCSKSSLEPQNFSANVLWASAVFVLSHTWGAELQNMLWGLWICLIQSVDCVTDQGDTGGHTVGSNRSVARFLDYMF